MEKLFNDFQINDKQWNLCGAFKLLLNININAKMIL